MFRRRKKEKVEEEIDLDIPNKDQLEKWVFTLVEKLELKQGEYTILPAYGGVLIYIKNQGITWVPYSEIRVVEKQIDKNKLMESSAVLGGLALATITGGSALPFLAVPTIIKGWYRSIAQPSPKKSVTILQSMISKIWVETSLLDTRLLDKFEDIPLKRDESKQETDDHKFLTYTLHIKKKYFSKKGIDKPLIKFIKNLMSVFTGKEEPIFVIHPQADTPMFLDALKKYGIEVEYVKREEKGKKMIEMPKDGIIIE